MPRELLAQHDAVERGPAQRVRDLLSAAAGLTTAHLLHVVAELLHRRTDRAFLRRRRVDAPEDRPDEEALPGQAALPAAVVVVERRAPRIAVVGTKTAPPLPP